MLPSRLFRNTGFAPPLRSLITPHPSLPSSLSVQIRFRLGVLQPLKLGFLRQPSSPYSNSSSAPSSQTQLSASPRPSPSTSSTSLIPPSSPSADPSEPRMSITFTCTAPSCSTRSTHQFTKRAYEKGIVLVQCPGCKNRHLIADHLGWFKEGTQDGKLKTVEDLVKARGEKVRRGTIGEGGEIVEVLE